MKLPKNRKPKSATLTLAEAKELLDELPVLVDVQTTAATLGVHKSTLQRWIAAGRLRTLKTSLTKGGRLRIPRNEIAELLVAMSGGGPCI